MSDGKKIIDENIIRMEKSNKNRKIIVLIAILCFIIILTILYSKNQLAKISDFTTAEVIEDDLFNELIVEGVAKSDNDYFISSTLEGKIENITKKVGEKIGKGELIATIGTEKYEKEIMEYDNDIKGILYSIEQEKIKQELNNIEYEKEYKNQDLKINAKEIFLENSKKLLELGSISREEFDMLSDSILILKNELRCLSEKNKAENRLSNSIIQSKLNEKEKQDLKIASHKDIIEKKFILSPGNGVLKKSYVENGDYIYEKYNCFVINSGIYEFELKLSQRNLNQIRIDQPVVMTFKNGDVLDGVIESIDNIVLNSENGFEYIPVKVKVEKKEIKGMYEGMTFTGRIQVSAERGVLLLPKDRFLADSDRKFVFVIQNDSDIAKKTEVVFGKSNEKMIEVISGLDKGDQVIISSYLKYKELDKIRIK